MFLDEAWAYGETSRRAIEASIGNGGIIGPRNVPTTNSANGVWLLEEVQQAKGAGTWPTLVVSVEYLVIGGGGGGGYGGGGGGGGAGGYRCNVSGENSGGLSSAEAALELGLGVALPIIVGEGGAAGADASTKGTNGGDTTFGSITSDGGGGGGSFSNKAAQAGGSGGGGAYGSGAAGAATANQGFAGGTGKSGGTVTAGGGGGAGEVGTSGASGQPDGGDGIQSSIDGTPTYRAGGGGGGSETVAAGVGGAGGGGNGQFVSGGAATTPTANSGSGGGGGYNIVGTDGADGVVIIRIPDTYVASFSGGVTFSLSTAVSGFNVYEVTATSDESQTVTFTQA